MYSLNNPVIGDHFLKSPRPDADGKMIDYIRHGENHYQYNNNDEVHDQGQAWMGFGWKLRQKFMSELGAAAGAALAESLVLPTMFAKASNIPAIIAQVLLADMDANGNMPHEADIRATAKIHGITLPKNPGKISVIARNLTEKTMVAVGLVSQDAALEMSMSKQTEKGENQISVGDKVLNVINGVGYLGKVKKLFADGTALVSYGFGWNDTFAPVSRLAKEVSRFGDMNVGDKVLNIVNGTGYLGKVKKLFANGIALVSNGFGWSDTFVPVAHLVKQVGPR